MDSHGRNPLKPASIQPTRLRTRVESRISSIDLRRLAGASARRAGALGPRSSGIAGLPWTADGGDSFGADSWFTAWRFAGLLALLIFASFPEVVTGAATFFHRDFALFGYPLAYYHRLCFWRGELPLWMPLGYCGLPFLAQWNTITLYPLSLIYLLFPLSWSLGVFCLGHLFLGGLGMYFLVEYWAANRFAAAVGGIGFAFSALMLHCLMWPGNIAALSWMPWVVLTVQRACSEGGRRILWAVFAGAMQMLSGTPEFILLTWVLLACLLALNLCAGLKTGWPMAARFALTGVLVGGLAAVQLLPFLDLLAHSHRDSGFGDSTWSMPLWGWANFLVPLFYAAPGPFGLYCQPGQYWVFSYYLGIGTFVFALLGALEVRQAKVRLLAALTVVCLILAWGDRGLLYAGLRSALPALGFMRYPVKFVILPAFTIPLLAGLYVGHWCGALDTRRARRRLIGLGGLAAAAAVGIVAIAFEYPQPSVSGLAAARSGLSRVAFLAVLIGLLVALRRDLRPRLGLCLRLAILALLWLDMMSMGRRPNPTVARSAYEPGLIRRESGMSSIPKLGESRAFLRGDTEQRVDTVGPEDPLGRVLYSRLALFKNSNLLDDIPQVSGFYCLLLREPLRVINLLYSTPNPPAGLADFLAVSQINAPGRSTQWLPRPTHLPWITGGQRPVFASKTATLRALTQPDFDPRATVFLPEDAQRAVSVKGGSNPQIHVRQVAAQRLRLEVKSAEPALVVIAQSYYHDWKARVDGRPVQLFRANDGFQACEVPAGDHQLDVRYQDSMFWLGLAVSGLSLAASGAIGLRLRKAVRYTG